jgi:hypothetical protein
MILLRRVAALLFPLQPGPLALAKLLGTFGARKICILFFHRCLD